MPGSDALRQDELRKHPGFLLARTRWQAFRNFHEHIGQPLGLKPVEYSILVLLGVNEQVSQRQLADALDVAAPNMTGILHKLEERELVERQRAEADRRVQYIVLTPKGAKLLKQANAASKEMDKDWLGRLTPGEAGMLLELLGKLADGK
ncbi:MAG: MarR family transcriptional regulator [Burkholderiales bacterium]|nr:MarR family transcriptional regulator [Burkholderiales bacterium]